MLAGLLHYLPSSIYKAHLLYLCRICQNELCGWSRTAGLISSQWKPLPVYKLCLESPLCCLSARFMGSTDIRGSVQLCLAISILRSVLLVTGFLLPIRFVHSPFYVVILWYQLSLGVGFDYWADYWSDAHSPTAVSAYNQAPTESLLQKDGNSCVKHLNTKGGP